MFLVLCNRLTLVFYESEADEGGAGGGMVDDGDGGVDLDSAAARRLSRHCIIASTVGAFLKVFLAIIVLLSPNMLLR